MQTKMVEMYAPKIDQVAEDFVAKYQNNYLTSCNNLLIKHVNLQNTRLDGLKK